MRNFIFDPLPSDDPPFLQCHGSTIARLPSGQFVVAWFAGTREMHPDTAIWWSRQEGDSWSEPKVAFKVDSQAHWNPVLFVDRDGRLLVHFKVGRFPDSWDTYRAVMRSDGRWGTPKKLASMELECGKVTRGPVRNKMVVLSNGTIIAPSSIERTVSRLTSPYQVEWNSVFHLSGNSGKTWKTTRVVGYNREKYGRLGGIIQPAVWESSPGVASAFFRSTTGVLFRSDSVDGGLTWADALPTGLPNPNSAVDVAVCGKILALVYNPVPINWGHRSPLSLSFSDLGGNRFTAPVDIESGPGNFSYPSMIPTDFGLAMTYTFNRRNIAFVEAKITEGKDALGNQTVDVGLSNGIKPYVWQERESKEERYDTSE